MLLSIMVSLFADKLLDIPPQRRWPMLALGLILAVVVLYGISMGRFSQDRLMDKVVNIWQKKEDEALNESFRHKNAEMDEKGKEAEIDDPFQRWDPNAPRPTIHDDFKPETLNDK